MDEKETIDLTGQNNINKYFYRAYKFLLALIWGQFFIFQYIRVFSTRILGSTSNSEFLMQVLFVVFAVLSLPYITKNIRKKDLILLIVLILVYMVYTAFFPDNRLYLDSKMSNICLVILPLYFVGLNFNAEKELDLLYFISVLNIISHLFYVLVYSNAMSEIDSLYVGNMDAAYKILPHVCLAIVYAFRKPGIFKTIIALSSSIYLISCGSRGPVVIAIFFTLYYSLFIRKYKLKKLAYFLIILSICIILIFFDSIVEWLETVATNMGMSVRIFDKMSNDMFWDSSGRDEISKKLLEAIKENPAIGYGIGGDYTLVGTYAHNILIECWVSYGVIIGTLLMILAVSILYKALKRAPSEDEKAIIFILLCSSFIKLFFSGTYLNETYFMFLFGICVGTIRRNKKIIME